MGRMSFTQELKALAQLAGEEMGAGDWWREVVICTGPGAARTEGAN
jgi:hypothetical protein